MKEIWHFCRFLDLEVIMEKKKIAVLGAGTMGPGIAFNYAVGGYETAIYSRSQKTLDRAASVIEASLNLFVREGILTREQADAAGKRMRYCDSVEAAVEGAWYVAETIVEQAQPKAELYEKLDAILPPEVIIASNTSYMDIFSLMPENRKPCTVISHFYAPAHILPLVEVVRGPETTEAVMEAVMALHRGCGRTPVRIEKYIPGFIVNRIQAAISREVNYLTEQGYCTPEDMDLAVKTSLVPRALILGVVQRMDFTGIDMIVDGMKNSCYTTAPHTPSPSIIMEPYKRGDYGVKTGKGIYDYGEQTYAEILARRDEQLLKSVGLAQYTFDHPLHKKEQ